MKKLNNLGIMSLLFASSISFAEEVPPLPIEGLIPMVRAVIGAVKWIGIVVAVIMVIYVGIKYLTAGAGTKADVKSNLLPMLIGAILIASAGTLVDAIFGIVTAGS